MSNCVFTCYSCHKQGHFAVNCPEKSNREQGSFNIDVQDIPDKQCPCGAGTCLVLTSKTEKNPQRKFYRCPLYKSPGTKCNFFKWCDASISDQRRQVSHPSNPECRCGAGKCNLLTVNKEGKNNGRKYFCCPAQWGAKCDFFEWCDTPVSDQRRERKESWASYPECSCGAGKCHRIEVSKEGKNKGRKFFVCPVKKGEGACNFFQWADDARNDENDSHLGEKKSLNSFWSTIIAQAQSKEKNSYSVKDVDDEVSSDKKQSESPSSNGCDVKEMVEVDSDVDDDAMPIAMHNLNLGEGKGAVRLTKPGNCFRCGKEGHWMKDCVRATAIICSKCGRSGHVKKDCTA